MINKHLFNFTLTSLWVQKKKTLFLITILSLLVFLVGSIFLSASSLERTIKQITPALPDIIVSNIQGGRQRDIDLQLIYPILDIKGVQNVIPRVWGSYYFSKADAYFHIVGVDRFDYDYASFLDTNNSQKGMVIGEGVKKILEQNYYTKSFSFITPKRKIITLDIIKTFPKESALLSYDIILMPLQNAKAILGVTNDQASDLAVYIPNKEEIDTIATKIKLLFPNINTLTKTQLESKYLHIYDYKGGVFLVVFLIALFTFFMIVSDRLSGVSSSEQKEIAILKALGWSIEDIIKEKFLQSIIIAFLSFLIGIIAAIYYTFILQAPLLRNIFEGTSALIPPFSLSFDFDITTFALIFFITIPIYIASVIIPAWRIALKDVDEVLR